MRHWKNPGAMLVKSAQYEMRRLPQSEWRVCGVCSGRGHYFEDGDLHRSPGTVPCMNCSGGTVKTETVMIHKPVYRVRARAL